MHRLNRLAHQRFAVRDMGLQHSHKPLLGTCCPHLLKLDAFCSQAEDCGLHSPHAVVAESDLLCQLACAAALTRTDCR